MNAPNLDVLVMRLIVGFLGMCDEIPFDDLKDFVLPSHVYDKLRFFVDELHSLYLSKDADATKADYVFSSDSLLNNLRIFFVSIFEDIYSSAISMSSFSDVSCLFEVVRHYAFQVIKKYTTDYLDSTTIANFTFVISNDIFFVENIRLIYRFFCFFEAEAAQIAESFTALDSFKTGILNESVEDDNWKIHSLFIPFVDTLRSVCADTNITHEYFRALFHDTDIYNNVRTVCFLQQLTGLFVRAARYCEKWNNVVIIDPGAYEYDFFIQCLLREYNFLPCKHQQKLADEMTNVYSTFNASMKVVVPPYYNVSFSADETFFSRFFKGALCICMAPAASILLPYSGDTPDVFKKKTDAVVASDCYTCICDYEKSVS